jgi:hypothetical protein
MGKGLSIRNISIIHAIDGSTTRQGHYSRTPLNIWFLVIYLFFVVWIGSSIRELSKEFLIPYERYYHMIMTLMERISIRESTKNRVLKKKV